MCKLYVGGLLLISAAALFHPLDDSDRHQQQAEAAAASAAEARVARRFCAARFNNPLDRSACLASFGLTDTAGGILDVRDEAE
jgi:hypothetical protein